MLIEYIRAAMKRARFEILPEGEGYAGEIADFPGLWADSSSLLGCQEALQDVLEGWILLAVARGQKLPVIEGLEIVASVAEAG